MSRANLLGVPAKRLDALLPECDGGKHDVLVMDVVDKHGRYDGAVRPRLHFRWIDERARGPLADARSATVYIDRGGDEGDGSGTTTVRVMSGDLVLDEWRLGRLATRLDGYRLQSLYMWHARRYYPHLDVERDGIQAAADAWAATIDPAATTKSEANRSASRDLYRISRDLGWRKLTAR